MPRPSCECSTYSLNNTMTHNRDMRVSLSLSILQLFSGPRCTSSLRANCTSELEDPVAPPPVILRDVSGRTVCVCTRVWACEWFWKTRKSKEKWVAEAGYWVEVKLDCSKTCVLQDEFSESVQISPQEIRLHLRTGILEV